MLDKTSAYTQQIQQRYPDLPIRTAVLNRDGQYNDRRPAAEHRPQLRAGRLIGQARDRRLRPALRNLSFLIAVALQQRAIGSKIDQPGDAL